MEIGSIVKVEFGINDPLNRQGQMGKVIKIKETEDGTEVSVLFQNLIGKVEIHCHSGEPKEILGLENAISEILGNAVADISQVPILQDDIQTQDTRLCNADKHFQEVSAKDLPSSRLPPNCDTEKKNKYQDPTLAHLHRMCMLLDEEAQRIEASYKFRPHLSRRSPERLERDFVSDVRSLVGHLSDRIFPYVQRSLDGNKNQHS